MSSLKSYQGGCHCGAIQFQISCEPITQGCQCNCSICRRKGATMSAQYFDEHFSLIQGQESLQCYQFGDHAVNHYFCKHCGIYPFHEVSDVPGRYRVNLGCIERVSLERLQIKTIDGASF
ncbi:GFA family protein [Aliikangiella coralliicola]|uniref:GFA family protein n=1 Tax=Aliikangiella coralliicola TaxID=2592383 RepID=A0A545UBV8_9GAMM|nr:GFA family protein [Aliikangiella coralliicola]TQV86950.1 GFA family protein [Aliikangiella coralliicola]